MIDQGVFADEMQALQERFGKDLSDGALARYYAYLDERLDTESFASASRSIWATNRFFPRPADFLAAEATAQWRVLLRLAEAWRPPYSTPDVYGALSERGGEAVRELGGISAVKDALDIDVVRFRRTWYDAYESVVALDAGRRDSAVAIEAGGSDAARLLPGGEAAQTDGQGAA